MTLSLVSGEGTAKESCTTTVQGLVLKVMLRVAGMYILPEEVVKIAFWIARGGLTFSLEIPTFSKLYSEYKC